MARPDLNGPEIRQKWEELQTRERAAQQQFARYGRVFHDPTMADADKMIEAAHTLDALRDATNAYYDWLQSRGYRRILADAEGATRKGVEKQEATRRENLKRLQEPPMAPEVQEAAAAPEPPAALDVSGLPPAAQELLAHLLKQAAK